MRSTGRSTRTATALSATTSTSSTCRSAPTTRRTTPRTRSSTSSPSTASSPVIATGNAGDITDTGGAPGNAASLAVASSVDASSSATASRSTARPTSPAIVAGQFSVAYDWIANGPTGARSGPVVTIPGDNADGCDPLTGADAAAVAGKVAWLEWDDNDATRRCGSVARAANVAAAGAIGAIFTSSLDVFGAGITGDADHPGLPAAEGRHRQAAPGRHRRHAGRDLRRLATGTIKDITPAITDTLSSFSSRGRHGRSAS